MSRPLRSALTIAACCAALAVTGCATTDGDRPAAGPKPRPAATPSAPPSTSSASPSTPVPPPRGAVTPVEVEMTAFAPVAMVGSTVYRDGTRVDTGIDDVATYVNLQGALLVATAPGRLRLWRDDRVRAAGRFCPEGGIRIFTDRTSRYAAVLDSCAGAGPRIRVYDSATGRYLLERPTTTEGSTHFFLDTDALYLATDERLVRVDLATGAQRRIAVRDPGALEDVVAGHLVLFQPGGARLVPVDRDAGGVDGRLTLLADVVSPGLHWGVALEQGLVVDNSTRREISPLPLPGVRRVSYHPYGWVGPDTISFESDPARHHHVIHSCQVAEGTCEQVVDAPTSGLVPVGGWTPFAD
ncbi:hypothetical protein BH11ACT8_BH11ACT8_13440 [soil metagenome]